MPVLKIWQLFPVKRRENMRKHEKTYYENSSCQEAWLASWRASSCCLRSAEWRPVLSCSPSTSNTTHHRACNAERYHAIKAAAELFHLHYTCGQKAICTVPVLGFSRELMEAAMACQMMGLTFWRPRLTQERGEMICETLQGKCEAGWEKHR
jgi:hypothetical protein